jgi:hypothetical protein
MGKRPSRPDSRNQRSTKSKPTQSTKDQPTDDDFSPSGTTDGASTHYCYAACMESTGQIYTNQTGGFVTPSGMGNNSLLILYGYNPNYIHVEPMRNNCSIQMGTHADVQSRPPRIALTTGQ